MFPNHSRRSHASNYGSAQSNYVQTAPEYNYGVNSTYPHHELEFHNNEPVVYQTQSNYQHQQQYPQTQQHQYHEHAYQAQNIYQQQQQQQQNYNQHFQHHPENFDDSLDDYARSRGLNTRFEDRSQYPESVPGQKGYTWTPPSILQAIVQSDNTAENSDHQYIEPNYTQPQNEPVQTFLPAPVISSVVEVIQQPPSTQYVEVVTPTTSEVFNTDDEEFASFLNWAALQSPAEIEKSLPYISRNIAIETTTDKQSLLHLACATGNISVVLYWFETFSYANHNLLDSNGMSPFHIACERGYDNIVRYLISTTLVDVTQLCSRGSNALIYAAYARQTHIVAYLLSLTNEYPSLSQTTNNDGTNAILASVESNDLKTLQVFAEYPHCNFLTRNKKGYDALATACVNGNYPMLTYLLSLGRRVASVNAVNENERRTCLHYACLTKQYTIVNYLVHDLRADTTIKDKYGKTPAEVVSNDVLLNFILSNYQSSPSQKISQHVPSPLKQSSESTNYAKSWIKPVEDLVENNSSSSLQNDEKISHHVGAGSVPTIVPSPAMSGTVGTTSRTFKKETKTYVPPTNQSFLPPPPQPQSTPTSDPHAKKLANDKVLNKLKTKEAKPAGAWIKESTSSITHSENDAKDVILRRKSTSDEEKVTYNSTDVSEPDTNHILNVTEDVYNHPEISDSPKTDAPSEIAASANVTEPVTVSVKLEPEKEIPQIIEKLVEYARIGAVVELEDYFGAEPDIKRDVRVVREASTNKTLLHISCRVGDLATTQYLLEGIGSDIDAVDDLGNTALYYAAVGNHVLVVRYLVKFCGANLEIKNNEGQTVLEALELNAINADSSDGEEIKKTIAKSIGKSPEKRTKVTIPIFK